MEFLDPLIESSSSGLGARAAVGGKKPLGLDKVAEMLLKVCVWGGDPLKERKEAKKMTLEKN